MNVSKSLAMPPHLVVFAATNEYSIEVLTAMLERFDANIQCRGPHAKLLREISLRVKALNKIRDFAEEIFGTENEGHNRVDSYRQGLGHSVGVYRY